MESKTFEQAEKFYAENENNLTEILFNEFPGRIEYQADWDQVAVWFNGFSLCYQDSDMNGYGLGEPHWNNDGANDGLDDLKKILENDDRFNPLIVTDEYHSHIHLEELINNFCETFGEKHNIADYFVCNQ